MAKLHERIKAIERKCIEAEFDTGSHRKKRGSKKAKEEGNKKFPHTSSLARKMANTLPASLLSRALYSSVRAQSVTGVGRVGRYRTGVVRLGIWGEIQQKNVIWTTMEGGQPKIRPRWKDWLTLFKTPLKTCSAKAALSGRPKNCE